MGEDGRQPEEAEKLDPRARFDHNDLAEIHDLISELRNWNERPAMEFRTRFILDTILTQTWELEANMEVMASADWFVEEGVEEYPADSSARLCGNCHALYCPMPTLLKPLRGPWKQSRVFGEVVSERDRYAERHWAVCSEGCYDVLERKLKFRRKQRDLEWQTIRLARLKLREARAWLRERDKRTKHPEASPSQTEGSRPEPTSQT